MTRIEERMIRAASDRVRGMTAVEAVEVLFREGLLSPRRCEQAAIRDEIARLERSGPPPLRSLPRRGRSLRLLLREGPVCILRNLQTLNHEIRNPNPQQG